MHHKLYLEKRLSENILKHKIDQKFAALSKYTSSRQLFKRYICREAE